MSIQCPLADEPDPNHSVQKVSALVAGEQLAEHPDYATVSPEAPKSDILTLLAAPVAPEAPRGTIARCWEMLTFGFMGFMALLCFILFPAAVLLDPEDESLGEIFSIFFVMAVLYFVAITVFYFVRAAANKVRYRLEKPQWERAMARWHNLYYCYHHEIVFQPETDQFRPAQLVNELLHTSLS